MKAFSQASGISGAHPGQCFPKSENVGGGCLKSVRVQIIKTRDIFGQAFPTDLFQLFSKLPEKFQLGKLPLCYYLIAQFKNGQNFHSLVAAPGIIVTHLDDFSGVRTLIFVRNFHGRCFLKQGSLQVGSKMATTGGRGDTVERPFLDNGLCRTTANILKLSTFRQYCNYYSFCGFRL